MSTEEIELINLIVQNRMSFHYANRKRYPAEKLAERDKLEDAFEALLKRLPREDEMLIRKHEDQILAECGDEDILYYCGGLHDGMHMGEFICKLIGEK